MLRGQDRRQWKGTYDLHFEHHSDFDSLEKSAGMECSICRVLWEEGGFDSSHPVHINSTASLKVIHGLGRGDDDELYRLDLNLEYGNTRRKRTFVLGHIGK